MISGKSKINIGRSFLTLYLGLLAISFSHYHNIIFYSSGQEIFSSKNTLSHYHNSSSHNATNCLILQFSATGYIGKITSELSVRIDSEILATDKLNRELKSRLYSLSLLRAPPLNSNS